MSQQSSESASADLGVTEDETTLNPPLVEPLDEDLWLDRLARRVGFGWLSEQLPGDTPPSYLFAFILVGTVVPITTTYAYVAGEPIVYAENPFFILQPVAVVGSVFGARALRRRYHRVTQEMQLEKRTDNPEPLCNIVPNWLPWALFTAALLQIPVRVWALGGLSEIYRESGLTDIIGWIIINPLWSVLAVQFVAVYLAIEVIAPWRLYRSDIEIDFLDPEGLGGLRPIGELVKHAYYYMMIGLIVFALIVYSPTISASGPTAATNAVFTAVWIGTILTVGFAVFILHLFLRKEKRVELHRLNSILREVIDNPWDIETYEIDEKKQEQVEELQQRINTVSATQEYPATFSIWSQLLVSIVLPKAFQLLLTAI